MSSYFLSYRRQDGAGHAGRLSDRLVARFGSDHVFMDVQDIQPGENFATAIEQTIQKCSHLLAVVGPRWVELLKARAAAGEDLVRHEIAVAMTHGLTIIPVLVGGARMPSAGDLPRELAPFARCQAVEIRDDRFDDDAADLVGFLGGAPAVTRPPVSRSALFAAAAALLVAAAGFYMARSSPAPKPMTLTGEWTGQFQKAGQPTYQLQLRLAQTGKMLAGSVVYPTGDAPIVESRIADDGTFTFATSHTPQFESEPATIRFQGEIVNGELRLVSTDRDGMATGVATRATP